MFATINSWQIHFLTCLLAMTTEAAPDCPSQAPDQMKTGCAQAGPCFEGPGCDADSGLFMSDQCMGAAMCGVCYPDSPCKSAKASVRSESAQKAIDLTSCMQNVTAQARAMALQFVSFNGGQNSKLHNVSQCGFQQLLLLNDTNPIHLVILFKTEDDSGVVKLLMKAAKSFGGGVVLRNQFFMPVIDMNFVTFLGLPSQAALVKMLGSTEFADAASSMKAEWSSLSMSVARMNIDVRVPATDCAHKPWDFDASLALPWPEKPGQEQTNKMFQAGDKGGAFQNLIFNKALSQQAATQATFDYSLGVSEATFRHGFNPHVAFTCIPAASGSNQRSPDFCRSVQLVGDTLMGYDTMRVVEYPSRRAVLSMMNDQMWKIEDKGDEWEWNVGVPSEPIVDATIADIPQLITPSFKALTGFDQAPTGCSDAVRQAQTRSDILNHTCYKKSAVASLGSVGDPCMSLFEKEANASCPAACQALVNELQPCLGGMWNTYSAGDALALSFMKAGQMPAKNVASVLTARAWYLEVERRGCRASVKSSTASATAKPRTASASSRFAQLNLICVAIGTLMLLMQ